MNDLIKMGDRIAVKPEIADSISQTLTALAGNRAALADAGSALAENTKFLWKQIRDAHPELDEYELRLEKLELVVCCKRIND